MASLLIPINELRQRNPHLFYFGLVCLGLAVVFLLLTKFTNTQVHGVNAWLKPFKFAISIFTFSWAMGWYCHYLPDFSPKPFSYAVIVLLGFEIIYIALQAGRGQESHFNTNTACMCLPHVGLLQHGTSWHRLDDMRLKLVAITVSQKSAPIGKAQVIGLKIRASKLLI